jgi:hypothetical protein
MRPIHRPVARSNHREHAEAVQRPGSRHAAEAAPGAGRRLHAADEARRVRIGHQREPALEILRARRAEGEAGGLQHRSVHAATALGLPSSTMRPSSIATIRSAMSRMRGSW